MAAIRDRYRDEAGQFRGYAADVNGRDEKNRANCARITGEREVRVLTW